MNATDTNAGGWEKSEIRSRLNTGDLWSLLPTEFQSKVKAVTKMTDNKGGGTAGTPSDTTDKVFLLSTTEVYGDLYSDGTQYEYYKSKGVSTSNCSGASGYNRWTRSVCGSNSKHFCITGGGDGNCVRDFASNRFYVLPAFCF